MGVSSSVESSRRVASKVKNLDTLWDDVEKVNTWTTSEDFLQKAGFCLVFSVFTKITNMELLRIIWKTKGAVSIIATKIIVYDNESRKPPVSSPRVLTIKQFYHLFCCLQDSISGWQDIQSVQSSRKNSLLTPSEVTPVPPLSSSSSSSSPVLDCPLVIDDPLKESDQECMICMEKITELALPCLHSFCEDCIKSWNIKSLTCPVCRNTVRKGTEDCWVLTDEKDGDFSNFVQESVAYISQYIDSREPFFRQHLPTT